MNAALRRDADVILRSSLNAVLPDEAVRRAEGPGASGGGGQGGLADGTRGCQGAGPGG